MADATLKLTLERTCQVVQVNVRVHVFDASKCVMSNIMCVMYLRPYGTVLLIQDPRQVSADINFNSHSVLYCGNDLVALSASCAFTIMLCLDFYA